MVSLFDLVMSALVIAILVVFTLAILPPRSVWLGLRSFERRAGVSPGAVLAAGTAGLLVLWAGIAASDEFGVVDALLTIAGALGPLGVAVGLAQRSPMKRLGAASNTPTGNPETGAIAVDGELRGPRGTFEVPGADDASAVSCAYALKKERDIPFRSRSRVWATIAEGERTRPLAVDDGSGAVRVDEAAVEIRAGRIGTRGYTLTLAEGETVPDDVAAFLAAVGVESPEKPDTDHRLKLRPFVPGDTVTAVGTYERVTRAGEAFWGITAGEGPPYLFGGDRQRVETLLRRRTRWLTAGGVALTLLGVVYIASLFGLLPW